MSDGIIIETLRSLRNCIRCGLRWGRGMLRGLGLDVFIYRKGYHYVSDVYGHAARKSIDIRELPEFASLAGKVMTDGRTLLYWDRLYTIFQAVRSVANMPNSGNHATAEVGVYKGGVSYFIASILDQMGEHIHHYAFDTFEGHDSTDINEQDPHQTISAFNDTSFESVKDYLSRFSDVSMVKGRIQDSCHVVDDKTFLFVHLDTDLYDPIGFALGFFEKKMARGGIIVIDDYGFVTCPGVKKAVDEFMSDNHEYVGTHLLTGQYMMVRVNS